jgi:hypothetical protein
MITIAEIAIPDSVLARQATEFVRDNLHATAIRPFAASVPLGLAASRAENPATSSHGDPVTAAAATTTNTNVTETPVTS